MLFQPPPAEHALWDAWLFPHAGEYHLFYQQKRAGERQTIAWGMRSRPISSTGARSPRRMSGARRVLKVNIATDLGLGALAALGREERLTAAAMSALPAMAIMRARPWPGWWTTRSGTSSVVPVSPMRWPGRR